MSLRASKTKTSRSVNVGTSGPLHEHTALSRSGKKSTLRASRTKSSSPAPPAGTDTIEEQYIENLQQQVYFLELENQYMRKRQKDAVPKCKSRGTDTGNADSWMLQDAVPLEDSMRALKEYYVKRETEHKEMKEALVQQHESDEKQFAQLQDTVANLTEQVESLLAEKENFDTLKEEARRDAIAEGVKLQNTIAEMTEQMELNGMEAARTEKQRDDALAKMEDMQLQIRELRDSEQKAQKSCKQLEGDLQKVKAELNRTREGIDFNPEEVEEAKEEARRSEAERKKCAIQVRQLELQVESLQQLKASNEDLLKSIGDKNWNLEDKNRKLEGENVDLKAKVDALTKDIADFHEEKANIDAIIGAKQDEIDTVRNALQDLEGHHRQVKDDFIQAQLKINKLESQIETMEADREAKREKYEQMDEKDAELRIQIRMATDNGNALRKQLEGLQAEHEQQSNALRDATLEIKQMKHRLEVAQSIDSLNLKEFINLQRTNMQVAENIQNLMQRLQTGGESAGSEEAA